MHFKFWICRGRHLNSFYAPLSDSKLNFLRFIAQSGKKGQYLDRCFFLGGGVGTTQSVQGHIIWNEKWQKKGKNRQDILFWSPIDIFSLRCFLILVNWNYVDCLFKGIFMFCCVVAPINTIDQKNRLFSGIVRGKFV